MDASTHQPDRPVINLAGEKVASGPLRRDLAPTYQRWMNDFAEMGSWEADVVGPITREAVERIHDEAAQRDDGRQFTVYEKATRRRSG